MPDPCGRNPPRHGHAWFSVSVQTHPCGDWMGGGARAFHHILEIRGHLRQCPAPDRGWREPGPEVSSCAFKVSASAAFIASQKVRVVASPECVTFFSQESVYKLVMQNKNVFFYWKILYPAVKFPDKSADGYVTTQK